MGNGWQHHWWMRLGNLNRLEKNLLLFSLCSANTFWWQVMCKACTSKCLIEWFVIIEYFLKMLSRFASGVKKKNIQVLCFKDMPSQSLSPRFMNSNKVNKYLHCTVVEFCIVFAQIQSWFCRTGLCSIIFCVFFKPQDLLIFIAG